MTDIDPHVQNAMYGTPEVNPDEQHHFLGTFRERVYMTQTKASVGTADYFKTWSTILPQHPDGVLLINGQLDADDIDTYMKLAQTAGNTFRLISDQILNKSPLGVVLTADHAVHCDNIEIEQLTEQTTTTPDEQTKPTKKSWFKKLFS